MKLNLKIWRQTGPTAAGRMEDYVADHVSPDMSFLEMLDVVNGVPHGPDRGTTVCQLHMRRFKDGDTITVEPWRAKAFPVVKDLVVDLSLIHI